MGERQQMVDNLEDILGILPPEWAAQIWADGDTDSLLEVVMDLGRKPQARMTGRNFFLADKVVTRAQLGDILSRVTTFGDDNRAGIESTLHRISAIRNRRGEVIGLTCRVGRSVYGAAEIIRDVLETGKSTLVLGQPGSGKTTVLREAARILSDERDKRVIVIDTSNEIAGDGDIPHCAIGQARRMHVTRTDQQHSVMIEAVENHMPEVIIIDEISTKKEVEAARTIAERGVQLIGTAHGNAVINLMANPSLNDLVGGIHAVTLSDDEAKRRGTQKTVQERKGPPTFEVVIELLDRNRVAVHWDVAVVIDQLLKDLEPAPEMRTVDENGVIRVSKPKQPKDPNKLQKPRWEEEGYTPAYQGVRRSRRRP